MTQLSACSSLLSIGLASMRKTALYLPCEGTCYRTLKSSTILSGTGYFFIFQNIWSTSGVLANWWTLIIEATSHECSQVTKQINTLYIINWQSIFYQELIEGSTPLKFSGSLNVIHMKQEISYTGFIQLSKYLTHMLHTLFIQAQNPSYFSSSSWV